MESLTIFIGVVVLFLLAARRHGGLERGDLVRPGRGRTGGLVLLLILRGRLPPDGAPAAAAERGAAGGLLGDGLRAARSALSSLLLLTFLVFRLPDVFLEVLVAVTVGRLAILGLAALRIPLLALRRRGGRGFS